MRKNDFLSELSAKLTNALPTNIQSMKKDLEKNFQVILQKAFAKLELVTREEFDSQSKVLIRTRKKLEALEKEVKALEELINK